MSGEGPAAHTPRAALRRRSTAVGPAPTEIGARLPVNEFGGTYNGRLWARGRAGIGVRDKATHHGHVNQSPPTGMFSAMSDRCHSRPHRCAIAGHPRQEPAFHDITTGANRYYPASQGWDFATGLGSPEVANLARDVAAYLKR